MSTIQFRFNSSKKFDAVTFSGMMIKLLELKRAIVDKKQLARGHLDFDLAVSNAQTNEVYDDDNMMIQKNTSVVVKRVPATGSSGLLSRLATGKTKGGGRAPKPIEVAAPVAAAPAPVDPRRKSKVEDPRRAAPAAPAAVPPPPPPAPPPPVDSAEDLNAVLANVMQSVDQFRPKAPGGPRGNMKWQAPGMTSVGGPSSFPGPGGAPQMRPGGAAPGGYPSAGGPGGATGGPGGTFAPRAYASGLPPPQYVCHRCGKGGHFIRECPENGNIDFDKPRVRHGVPGVPRTLWQVIGDDDEVEDGKTLARGPDGQTIVIQPSGVQFDRLVRRNAAQHQTREALAAAAHDAPRHFLCPMCAKVIDDAVLVPCCFESLCDSCARDSLRQSGGRCPLCSKAAAEDKLVPNKSLRAGVQTFLQQWAANTKAKLEDERDAQLLDRADEAPMSLNPLMHNKAPDAVLELRRAAAADDDVDAAEDGFADDFDFGGDVFQPAPAHVPPPATAAPPPPPPVDGAPQPHDAQQLPPPAYDAQAAAQHFNGHAYQQYGAPMHGMPQPGYAPPGGMAVAQQQQVFAPPFGYAGAYPGMMAGGAFGLAAPGFATHGAAAAASGPLLTHDEFLDRYGRERRQARRDARKDSPADMSRRRKASRSRSRHRTSRRDAEDRPRKASRRSPSPPSRKSRRSPDRKASRRSPSRKESKRSDDKDKESRRSADKEKEPRRSAEKEKASRRSVEKDEDPPRSDEKEESRGSVEKDEEPPNSAEKKESRGSVEKNEEEPPQSDDKEKESRRSDDMDEEEPRVSDDKDVEELPRSDDKEKSRGSDDKDEEMLRSDDKEKAPRRSPEKDKESRRSPEKESRRSPGRKAPRRPADKDKAPRRSASRDRAKPSSKRGRRARSPRHPPSARSAPLPHGARSPRHPPSARSARRPRGARSALRHPSARSALRPHSGARSARRPPSARSPHRPPSARSPRRPRGGARSARRRPSARSPRRLRSGARSARRPPPPPSTATAARRRRRRPRARWWTTTCWSSTCPSAKAKNRRPRRRGAGSARAASVRYVQPMESPRGGREEAAEEWPKGPEGRRQKHGPQESAPFAAGAPSRAQEPRRRGRRAAAEW
ncbi:hypothetical protein M885DRAFT_471149 [Pelagophyceae sp. CCMP2097]|nr:hypothetical protein M885DRAFT_471149 [Pelagophyceae sp. CCMP2097]